MFAILSTLGLGAGEAYARSLRQVLVPPALHEIDVLRGALPDKALASAIATQVANQLPSSSTSTGFAYVFDPTADAWVHETRMLGSLFVERAQTIGRNRISIGLAYSYVQFATFNGNDIHKLRSRFAFATPAGGNAKTFYGLIFRRPGSGATIGAERENQVDYDLDIDAHIFDVTLTYGVLNDLDVNVDIPILRTSARSSLTGTSTDPRCVQLEGPDFQPDGFNCLSQFARDNRQLVVRNLGDASATSLGVGDVRLRTKYAALQTPMNIGALFELAMPTGSRDDFRGTGDTRLGTILIATKDRGWLEMRTQGGVEVNVNDVVRSQARYAAGASVAMVPWLGMSIDFIGRSEFAPQSDIPDSARLPAVKDGRFVQSFADIFVTPNTKFHGRPYFGDIKRNDILDLSVGLRVDCGGQTLVMAGALVPLNDDGIRARVVPSLLIEHQFGLSAMK